MICAMNLEPFIPAAAFPGATFSTRSAAASSALALGGLWAAGGKIQECRHRVRISRPRRSRSSFCSCAAASATSTPSIPRTTSGPGKLIDAIGFGDNLAEMKRPGDPLPAHLHALRQIGHSGFRLVSARRRRDRRDRRGPLDVVQRRQSFPGRHRNADRPSRPAVRSSDLRELGFLRAGHAPTRTCRRS